MKKQLLILSIIFCSSVIQAQVTVQLKPGALCGKDALLHGLPSEANINYGNNDQLPADAWTFSGNPGVVRAVLEFDLSSIPVGATVQSATLSLHAIDFTNGLGQHSGQNASWLRRVTSPWGESTVTWNTQPSYTTQNEVALPASSSPTQDYPNINVAALVQDMVNDPQNSFGFMLMLQVEQIYSCLNFCSSDHANPSFWPSLTITYLPPVNVCLFTRIDASCDYGQDALLHGLSSEANMNYGTNDQLPADAWTFSGIPGVVRSVFEFDLSAIPANAIIDSASLSLYAIDFTTGLGQHAGSGNDAWLERVTSPWNEFTVTWNTQPSTTIVNRVAVPASISPTEDYLDMDVSQLVIDMHNNPSSSFGFMLKLNTEQQYRCLNFCSGNHANTSKHPKLKVCYHISTAIEDNDAETALVYPNPAATTIEIRNSRLEIRSVEIYNCIGEKIYSLQPEANNLYQAVLNISNFPEGIYFVNVIGGKERIVKKVVIQR